MGSIPAAANVIRPQAFKPSPLEAVADLAGRLGIDARAPESLARTLPFTRDDTTAGVENEIQAAGRALGRGSELHPPMGVMHAA